MKLRALIYDMKKSEANFSEGIDARVVLVFENKTGSADYFVLKDRSLIRNSNSKFDYDFNILDSVKVLLNKPVIDCPAN
jgi:hypothetical protein